MGTPLIDRIRDRQICDTCGGSRLSGTGHKIWCSGHILAPKPVPVADQVSPFTRRLMEKRLSVQDFTWYNGALTPTDGGGAA